MFNEVQQQESTRSSTLIYVVKDFPDKEYAHMHELKDLTISIEKCALCSKARYFPDIDDAFMHLHQFHFRETTSTIPDDQKLILGHWLATTQGAEVERRNSEMIDLLEAIHRRAKKLLYKAMEMRSGVADENKEKPSNYLLPSALVKAAEKVFQFIYTSLYAVRYLREQPEPSLSQLFGKSPLELKDNIALADWYGVAADVALSKAQNELLLMAHTGSIDGASVVSCMSSTPETTILYSLFCLMGRRLLQDFPIWELYRNHLSSLVSERLSRTLIVQH